MATSNLSNSSTQDVVRHILWNLWVDHDGTRAKSDSDPIYFVSQIVNLPGLIATVHTSMNAGIADDSTKILSQTDKLMKFQSTGFSDEGKDLDVTYQLNGVNLLKNDASTVVNQTNLNIKGTRYNSGQTKSPANISEKFSDTQTWVVNYQPSLITNQTVGDGIFTFTSLATTNGKSESYSMNNGVKVTDTNTYQESFSGKFIMNENGQLDGNLKKLSNSESSIDTNGVANKYSIGITSTAGLLFNEEQTLQGAIAIKFNQEYKDGAYNQLINFSDSAENADFAGALTQFIDGQNTIDDLATILFSKDDKITAKGGNNTLNGYGGNDTLTGGAGNDYFEFTTALDALTNIDKINSFKKAGSDKIQLDDAVFTGYSGANNFVLMGNQIVDADDRIFYNKNTGQLFYDADGNGSTAPIQFATLVGKPTLTAADITII